MVALLVVLPSGAATIAAVRGRVAGRASMLRRVFVIAGYSLSAPTLVSLGLFLLADRIRIVGLTPR